MYTPLGKQLAAAHAADVARRARLRDRLAARWRAASLDRSLADGVVPASPALVLRAHVLIGPKIRTGLAEQVERIVSDARLGHRSLAARIPTRRREVIGAARELEELAGRLLAPGPVSAHGVAQVRLLLTDACGPLYHHRAAEDLRTAVSRALRDLDVLPDR